MDTTTPTGKAMFQMLGVFAEFERSIIQERVRAGLARARDEGKQLGRPKIAPDLEKRIHEALRAKDRPGVRVIAEQFGVAVGTVQRINHVISAPQNTGPRASRDRGGRTAHCRTVLADAQVIEEARVPLREPALKARTASRTAS